MLAHLNSTLPAFSGTSFVHTRDGKKLVCDVKVGDQIEYDRNCFTTVKYVVKITLSSPIKTIKLHHMNACTCGPNNPDTTYVSFAEPIHVYAGLFSPAKGLQMPFNLDENAPDYQEMIAKYEEKEKKIIHYETTEIYNFISESNHCVHLGSECICVTWGYNPSNNDYTSNNKSKPKKSQKFIDDDLNEPPANFNGYNYQSHNYETDGIPIAFLDKKTEIYHDPYFGTSACVNDIAKISTDGYVNLTEENFKFDSSLTHITEIVPCVDEHISKKQKK